jgi:hypothetical protein
VPKIDFPPLLAPGIHALTLVQLENLTVSAFPMDNERTRLFTLLSLWINKVQALNVSAILWIDGSFLTKKIAPGDIDCVVWSPTTNLALTPASKIELNQLFGHDYARVHFGLDLYLEIPAPDQVLHREAYWRGFFGFQHDRRTAKGFVELKL